MTATCWQLVQEYVTEHGATIVITIEVALERDGDRIRAYAPALKGLHVDGATEEEALEATKEAISQYIISLIRHKESLPVGCMVLRIIKEPPL